uniref:Uncharacterized protein n=1 Tax=Aegilops tauschii TaxID=37682 RepID=M8C7T7_AEGTA
MGNFWGSLVLPPGLGGGLKDATLGFFHLLGFYGGGNKIDQRDANTSLPEKGYRPLRAQGTTSQGVDFGIALCLADPPGTSRLYVLFPSGTDPNIACDLVAAHGDSLLFMITDLAKPGESSLALMCHQDLFVCRVASPDQPPLLRRLPACTDLLIRSMVHGVEMTMQHLLFPQGYHKQPQD